jgi:hypothetical protein
VTGIRLFALSRSPIKLLGVITLLSIMTWLTARAGITLDFEFPNKLRQVPFLELVPVLGGCLIAALLRPRFYEWERLGERRSIVASTATVLIGIAVPVIPVLVGVLRLPREATWTYIPANVVLVTAIAFTLSALVGPAIGPPLAALAFVATCLLQNLEPALAGAIPLAKPPESEGPWIAAITATLIALAVHIHTAGASTLARRLNQNEE